MGNVTKGGKADLKVWGKKELERLQPGVSLLCSGANIKEAALARAE